MVEGARMGLSIKNAEVERMVREIASTRGVSMTEALRQVLAEEVERQRAARQAEIEARVAAVMAIAREVAAMPEVGDMTDDEVLGYDEDGIPSR
jgi:antitoxin VapB